MFQDITTLLLDHKAFKNTVDIFVDRYRDMGISVVAGYHSSSFFFYYQFLIIFYFFLWLYNWVSGILGVKEFLCSYFP
jgi:hypothetical protein